MTTGSMGHLGLKQEAGYGQEATTPEVFGIFYSESISMDNRLIRPAMVNGTRFVKETLMGVLSQTRTR